MSKWIETNDGSIINLNNVCGICKAQDGYRKGACVYGITYFFAAAPENDFIESFSEKSERDKRFAKLKAMLL